jgi:peptidoglycan/xylan/chitin deacetylase (PgdA/CDA1 family)
MVVVVVVAQLLTLVASAYASAAQQPILNVKTKRPVVALTFDDGPSQWMAPQFLKLFRDEGVKVTFFVIGSNVVTHPQIARDVLQAGHELGNHSMDHADLTKLGSEEEIRDNITRAHAAIKEATGIEAKVFRAPFIAHDDKTWRVLNALKLPSISGRLDTRDWDGNSTPTSIADAATLTSQPGDIIIMHEWNDKTFQAMPEIIRRFKAKGFVFVTVSEMLALDGKK